MSMACTQMVISMIVQSLHATVQYNAVQPVFLPLAVPVSFLSVFTLVSLRVPCCAKAIGLTSSTRSSHLLTA